MSERDKVFFDIEKKLCDDIHKNNDNNRKRWRQVNIKNEIFRKSVDIKNINRHFSGTHSEITKKTI